MCDPFEVQRFELVATAKRECDLGHSHDETLRKYFKDPHELYRAVKDFYRAHEKQALEIHITARAA